MQLPLQIGFQNVPHTEEAENIIRETAHKLDAFAGDLMSCRGVVDMPHRHHQKGNLYQVRIDLTLRDVEIAVNHEPPEHETVENFRAAVTESFDTAARLLEDYVRRRRKSVKAHTETAHVRVAKLFPNSNYGFHEMPDGRGIYFHRNSELDDGFQHLSLGTEVSFFAEEEGEKGPPASKMKIAGRHHHVL